MNSPLPLILIALVLFVVARCDQQAAIQRTRTETVAAGRVDPAS